MHSRTRSFLKISESIDLSPSRRGSTVLRSPEIECSSSSRLIFLIFEDLPVQLFRQESFGVAA